MPEDWLADVRRYAPNADPKVVEGLVRYCGIALRNRDSALVSFSSPDEIARVRERFLKKKLALTHPDAELDEVIVGIGETMQADRTKNRVTVYYLLADRFDQLPMFLKKGAGKGASAKPAETMAESPAPLDHAAADVPPSEPEPIGASLAAPASDRAAPSGFGTAPTTPGGPVREERRFASHEPDEAPVEASSSRWWLWLVLILLALLLLYLLFG
jgi:hypothetical protein